MINEREYLIYKENWRGGSVVPVDNNLITWARCREAKSQSAVWNNKISTEHADRERAIEVQQQENAVDRRQEQLNNIYNYTDTGINCRSYTIGSSVYTECD